MKNGFTLIEIIIAIALITVVGTTSIVVLNKSKDNDLFKIENTVLEAAKVYVSMEKDDKGNTYEEGIFKGGNAVAISFKHLLDKGYITKENIKTLEDNGIDTEKEYLLAAVYDKNKEFCGNSPIIEFKTSWELSNETDPVYLCDYSLKNSSNSIFEMFDNIKYKVDLNKVAVSEDFFKKASEEDKNYLTAEENGVYIYIDEEIGKKYLYFRGAVENNYLKLGKDETTGADLIWRILWIDESQRMKLVLDTEVVGTLKGSNGDIINLKSGDKYYYYSTQQSRQVGPYCNEKLKWNYICRYNIFNPSFQKEGYTDIYVNPTIVESINITKNNYDNSGYYYKILKGWYDKTNLSNFDFILKDNNFCENSYGYFYGNTNQYYLTYNGFSCITGDADSYKYYTILEEDNISSPVGFLNVQELRRAGIVLTESIDYNISGNYLIPKNNNSYILADLYNVSDSDHSFSFYYVNNKGLKTGYFFDMLPNVFYNLKIFLSSEDREIDNYLSWISSDSSGNDHKRTFFLANSVKPAVVLDFTKLNLAGNGTIGNPYIITN